MTWLYITYIIKNQIQLLASFNAVGHFIYITTESYLETSAFLYIEVSVNGKSQGSRQVKCERNMDTLSQILSNSKNPIDLMCQASILKAGKHCIMCEEYNFIFF